MVQQLKKRNEVTESHTWNLSTLVESDEIYDQRLAGLVHEVDKFAKIYKGNLTLVEIIIASLDAMRPIQQEMTQLSVFASLNMSSDQTDAQNVNRQGRFQIEEAKIADKLSFFTSELLLNDEETLLEVSEKSEENKLYILELLREKKHTLSPEVEAALTSFSQVFSQPYRTYGMLKLADMKFEDFTVDGKNYPLSFVLFENEWEYEIKHDVRHAAYQAFYQKLASFQNGFASNFQTEVLKEKAMANLKGFDSVIEYLLFDQKVSVEMYDRQIDVIMEKLAPAMRKYAKLLQEIHGLEKMEYADLKLPVDADFEPTISIADSRQYVLEGLDVLGADYKEMIERAYAERWIDFPQNVGKSTGAFCNTPYGSHPFILISWTEKMREVFVLAHELGHAGHFYLSGQNQNIYNTRPSLYFIEAPSTMNELLVAEHMIQKADNPRMKRWVYASMISRTYYHNFVTHLLEAAYQREVYRYVDAGKPLSAKVLNELTVQVLRQFWGDAVEIPDYAGLTWMRQPHYFMGLYPYTYSAGLTISTAAVAKLGKREIEIEQWKDMLKAGGTKDPVGLAKMVDVDITTEQPLLDTIDYISDMIEQVITLTAKM